MGAADKVRAAVEIEFDRAAANYAGKTEANDVISAQAAVMSWIREANCKDGEGICVEANGSRGESWCNVKVECSKIRLLI